MKQSDVTQLFAVPWASQADSSTIASIPTASTAIGRASMALGFPKSTMTPIAAGGVPPYGEDMNGILAMLSIAARASEAGVIRPFSASFANAIGGYPAGATIAHPSTAGRFLICTQDNNTNDPGQSMNGWADPLSGFQASGDFATNEALQQEVQRAKRAESGFLPLTGGTLTGDVTIVGNGTYGNTRFGGKVVSGVAGQQENSYLQTQINDDVPLTIIGQQNANGWHSWTLNPNDLSFTNPAGNSIPEVVGPSGRVVEQAFIVTGNGSGGSAGEAWISFPVPFRSGTTPVVTAVINREAGVGVSRTVAFGNIGKTSNPNITHNGFSFQPIYLISDNIGSSGKPWTLHVRAIGTM